MSIRDNLPAKISARRAFQTVELALNFLSDIDVFLDLTDPHNQEISKQVYVISFFLQEEMDKLDKLLYPQKEIVP